MHPSNGLKTPRTNVSMNLEDELAMSEDELVWEDEAQSILLSDAPPIDNTSNHSGEQENDPVQEHVGLGPSAENFIGLQREGESSIKSRPRRAPERRSASASRDSDDNSRMPSDRGSPITLDREQSTAEETPAASHDSTGNPYSIDEDVEVKKLTDRTNTMEKNVDSLISRMESAVAGMKAQLQDVDIPSAPEEQQRVAPPRSQRKEGKFRPKRPTYDKMMPGGIPEWARAEFLYENETKRTRELIVRVQLMRSQMALTQGDYQESMEYAIKAGDETRTSLRYQPLLARCAAWRGKAELRAGLFDQAVESLEEAMYCKGKYFEGEWVERELAKAKLFLPATPRGGLGPLGPKPKSRWRSSVYAVNAVNKGKQVLRWEPVAKEPQVEIQEEDKDEEGNSDTESETLESEGGDDGWYQGKMRLPVSSDDEDMEGPSAFRSGPTINPFTGEDISGLSGHVRKQSGSIPAFLNLRARKSTSSIFTEGGVLMEDIGSASDGEITAKPKRTG